MNNFEWLYKNDRDVFIARVMESFDVDSCDYCTEDNNTCESYSDKYCAEHIRQWLEAEHMDNIRTDKDMSICDKSIEDNESCVQQLSDSCNLGNSGSLDLPSIPSTNSREKLERDINSWISAHHNDVWQLAPVPSWLDRQAAITRAETIAEMRDASEVVVPVYDINESTAKLMGIVHALTSERDVWRKKSDDYRMLLCAIRSVIEQVDA